MTLIHRLIESLPPDEVAVWEDEADIDLNPKIGSDWTLPGDAAPGGPASVRALDPGHEGAVASRLRPGADVRPRADRAPAPLGQGVDDVAPELRGGTPGTTWVRKLFSVEDASVGLGHSNLNTSDLRGDGARRREKGRAEGG